ncbi:MAG: lipoyl(octanoyl) transferase LipB [Ignavibacteriaceae bacterium]|nr:lipoyl(octanoyl) transferase LipB [Ignavibacteriaceae bacterium]
MVNQFTSKKELWYCDCGLLPYAEAWELQKQLFLARKQGLIPDVVLLLEHPHTYTLGKVASKDNLLSSEDELRAEGINIFEIDRGGDITYHGPGQVVGYPIIDLNLWQKDSHKYLRALEELIISTASEYGLECGRNPKYTGVWIQDRKIAAIGIKISSWITMHGFAFNVNTELKKFNGIIPCGITDKSVTSLEAELCKPIEINEVKSKLLRHFINIFGHTGVVKTSPTDIKENLFSKVN